VAAILPNIGVGLGYRPQLHDGIMRAADEIDWLELIAEDFLPLSERRRDLLLQLAERFRCVLHCTELSLGSAGPVDRAQLADLTRLADLVDSPWVSDHFCFTSAGGVRLGHLAPVQWTRESAAAMAAKAKQVTAAVGRPFLLENIAYNFVIPGELTEPQFITSVLEDSDCHLLLDVTNVYTNATNLGFDPVAHIDELPLHRLGQLHVAGGTWLDGVLVDSHDAPVPAEVWPLVCRVAGRTTVPAAMLERDASFPADFGEILGDLRRARDACAEQAG
jgi:uncharacterized protein (UPF0276 family)